MSLEPREAASNHLQSTSLGSDLLHQEEPPRPLDTQPTFLRPTAVSPRVGSVARPRPGRLPRTIDALKNAKFLFVRTPEELSDDALDQAALNNDRIPISSSWGNYSPRSQYVPQEPNYIRVRLFQDINGIIRETCLFDDIPTCLDGGLNLGPTMEKWKIQNMTVFNTAWNQYIELGEPFTLSQGTLESLVNEYHLLVVLEKPSAGMVHIRQLRHRFAKQMHRLGGVWREVDPVHTAADLSYSRGTTVVVVEEPSEPSDSASILSWPSGVFSCCDLLAWTSDDS